ncbi:MULTISPECIES: EF-hand domain-containing protein [Pseudoalteromonas]|uniref:EF-hand domain-containing protein n=1 Tax=Pseudoalteromonas rubra TaxID=43658 RepID=A0A5S3US93_9GAMM|nr:MULTISPECIES: EF-hand domain-containing protein [Pseudoalteromonas]MCG7561200.1 EF-hand domain-containing protein [Pseudoalteromonas sp. McH1-42]QPB85542.1 EF-hand domain-containing protein [Pseudoalteromonas rubra]
MQITYVFALTLGMFTCALAFATEVDFALLDDNSDGLISRSEAAKVSLVADAFKRLDTNRDGALSAKEFKHFNKHL